MSMKKKAELARLKAELRDLQSYLKTRQFAHPSTKELVETMKAKVSALEKEIEHDTTTALRNQI